VLVGLQGIQQAVEIKGSIVAIMHGGIRAR